MCPLSTTFTIVVEWKRHLYKQMKNLGSSDDRHRDAIFLVMKIAWLTFPV